MTRADIWLVAALIVLALLSKDGVWAFAWRTL